MIALGDSSEGFDRSILGSPGGFGWWYGDLLDDGGNGLVVIAAYGLPFLPGPGSPSERPSLNVALYRDGAPSLYLLEELDPADAPLLEDGDGCRMGASRVESSLVGGRRVFDVQLDCALPGTTDRLVGSVHIEGPATRTGGGAPAGHLWTPLALGASARAHVRVGDEVVLDVRGRGYHDRNTSPVALGELGISHWLWGRVPDGTLEHVFYLLWPEGQGQPIALVLHAGPDGTLEVEEARVSLEGWRLTRYGLSWWRRIGLETRHGRLDVHFDTIVDNGPFYQRFIVRGPGMPGIAERVVPSRIELPFIQPFVRMCVHRPTGASSFLAPWFVGEREGRLSRLLSSWSAA